jgi:hypothetical protein
VESKFATDSLPAHPQQQNAAGQKQAYDLQKPGREARADDAQTLRVMNLIPSTVGEFAVNSFKHAISHLPKKIPSRLHHPR